MNQHLTYIRNIVLLLLFLTVIVSCAKKALPPFALKHHEHPKPIHCFDGVDHMPGSVPFIMGGTCFCTPTQSLMDQYHANGKLLDMQLDDLLRLYKERGIHLVSREHQNCNNLCEWGPHVLKGGNCMVAPTPGTRNYEEIRYGLRYMPVQKK